MATPTNLPASFTTGAVLTAAQMNDLRGAFRILQIEQDTTSTVQTTTSSTFADTALSISFTCQSNTSKVLAIFNGLTYADAAATEASCRLMRGTTELALCQGTSYSSAGNNVGTPVIIYLDSPASTSAQTYKIQVKRFGGTGTIYFAPNSSLASLTLLEVSA